MRRKKHRAPVIPYHLHTVAPKTSSNVVPDASPGSEGEAQTQVDLEASAGRKDKKETKRPPPFGQEGRGVGFGFNPVFREAYGGGGGMESGKAGHSARRVTPVWG